MESNSSLELDISSQCTELRPLMSDYIDDQLDAATRQRLDAHIAICPNCPTLFKAMLETYLALSKNDQAQAQEEVPSEVRARLRDKLLQAINRA